MWELAGLQQRAVIAGSQCLQIRFSERGNATYSVCRI
jgi:hypothetical protein